MVDTVERYKHVNYCLPETNLKWPLYGAGLENLGRDKKPVEYSLPDIEEDQILVRVDAVGLCFSDIKLIRAGSEHPRIMGRDLARNPTVPGHEVAMTVVEVGPERAGQFEVGERYLIQADIVHNGVGKAFGYALEGGLQQYCVIGEEVLEGDDGCYLLSVSPEDGYAEVALSEPWACVEAAYRMVYRKSLKPDGRTWVVAGEEEALDYSLDGGFDPDNPPAEVIVSGRLPQAVESELQQLSGRLGFDLEQKESGPYTEKGGEKEYDDIIVIGRPDPDFIEYSASLLKSQGTYIILAQNPVGRRVEIDVGRIHYDGLYFTGSDDGDLKEAFEARTSFEMAPGGRIWILGAGGPMGQMHTQRALEREDGPELVVATDIDEERLDLVRSNFQSLAEKYGKRLVTINPQNMDEREFVSRLDALTGGQKFTEVVVMAPVPALVEQGDDWVGNTGVLNIFAGIPVGKTADLDISSCYLEDCRWVGSSGSSISDLQLTLGKTERGELNPNRSVAAIGGLNAAWKGLEAVRDGTVPGKIVIWPQIPELPLLAVEELSEKLPEVASRLRDGNWTREAEEELIRSFFL